MSDRTTYATSSSRAPYRDGSPPDRRVDQSIPRQGQVPPGFQRVHLPDPGQAAPVHPARPAHAPTPAHARIAPPEDPGARYEPPPEPSPYERALPDLR
jgi:hypothetical protein